MDSFPLPDGFMAMDPVARCLNAIEGYAALGMPAEVEHHIVELEQIAREEFALLSPVAQEMRKQCAAKSMPSLAAVFGWNDQPAP